MAAERFVSVTGPEASSIAYAASSDAREVGELVIRAYRQAVAVLNVSNGRSTWLTG